VNVRQTDVTNLATIIKCLKNTIHQLLKEQQSLSILFDYFNDNNNFTPQLFDGIFQKVSFISAIQIISSTNKRKTNHQTCDSDPAPASLFAMAFAMGRESTSTTGPKAATMLSSSKERFFPIPTRG
jgi:hypothetical protein